MSQRTKSRTESEPGDLCSSWLTSSIHWPCHFRSSTLARIPWILWWADQQRWKWWRQWEPPQPGHIQVQASRDLQNLTHSKQGLPLLQEMGRWLRLEGSKPTAWRKFLPSCLQGYCQSKWLWKHSDKARWKSHSNWQGPSPKQTGLCATRILRWSPWPNQRKGTPSKVVPDVWGHDQPTSWWEPQRAASPPHKHLGWNQPANWARCWLIWRGPERQGLSGRGKAQEQVLWWSAQGCPNRKIGQTRCGCL